MHGFSLKIFFTQVAGRASCLDQSEWHVNSVPAVNGSCGLALFSLASIKST